MNLEERIQNAVMEKLNDGTVEQIVKDSVESAIKKSLENTFSWSGAGKKMIDEKVKEVIIPVIERHDFNQYIVKLDSVLTEIINQTSLSGNKEILGNFKALMIEPSEKAIKKLGELEDAEDKGRLVVLPCKARDMVYIIFDKKIYKGKCDGFEYDRLMSNWFIKIKTPDLGKTFEIFEDIGKTIFFTKEEAEKALKEMEEKQGE